MILTYFRSPQFTPDLESIARNQNVICFWNAQYEFTYTAHSEHAMFWNVSNTYMSLFFVFGCFQLCCIKLLRIVQAWIQLQVSNKHRNAHPLRTFFCMGSSYIFEYSEIATSNVLFDLFGGEKRDLAQIYNWVLEETLIFSYILLFERNNYFNCLSFSRSRYVFTEYGMWQNTVLSTCNGGIIIAGQ